MFSIFYAQWIQYIVWGKKQNTPRVALTDNYPSEINILLWQNMKCFNKMKNKKYHTVETILKYHTVETILKYHTVAILKYHTVETILKYHTVETILKYHTVETILKNKHQNHRKRQNRYSYHTNTWPLIFLAWHRHFNKNWQGQTCPHEYNPSFLLKRCGHAWALHMWTKGKPHIQHANSPIMKNVIILNTTHNTLNHHHIEVAMCAQLSLLKRIADGLNHYPNIR